MIFWYGLTSELEAIRRHLTNKAALEFREIPDENVLEPLETAELVLIGPSIAKPVTLIQRVVARDKHISIIVLAESLRYNPVRRSIQFSFGVGKTSSCVVFNPEWDYTSIFEKAVVRTRQKRSFVKFNRSADQLLSIADSPAARLENLSEILEHAPVGVLLVDDALNVLAANRMSRTMFRVLDQKPVPLYILLPASYAERLRAFGEHPGTPTLTVEDHSGNYYEVIGSAIPGKMEKQLLLLISDITEKYGKDLRFTAVLESLPHIAWAADAGGHINYYNRGWYEYTNTEPTEGMGDRWQSIVHPDDLQQFKQHWDEAVREGKVFQHATRLKRYDGEYRWHLSKAVPIFSKNRLVTMWVGTGTDIHEQVRRNEELERKVKERTKLLEETNAELENFAHISSHDLQEPLRKMQTFSYMAIDELPEDAGIGVRRYLEKIIETSDRMSSLLRDLLDYSRINQGEPLTVVNLSDIISEIRIDLELAISQNEASLTVDSLPVLTGRPLQIKQLFYNIITNSLKYRKSGVRPQIIISSQKASKELRQELNSNDESEYWEIIVKDNGIGFDQKYAEQIFTVFQRLHSRSAYEGTGIGLAIARKVVNNHGGDIFAISAPGEGAEFHVVLPGFEVGK